MSQAPSEIDLRRLHDQQIRAWFGEVRPLRLEGSGRFFTPPPALPLRAVFVPPALSPTYFQPTVGDALLGGGADVLQWFGKQRRLVVLGDPGSGKSTLVSWLAWRLCAGLTERLPDWADGVLPVPMILRDMQLGQVSGFADLLAAYVRTDLIAGHPQLRQAWGQHLQGVIERQPGALLFLIDGLDELSAATRDKVRDAIREGMARLGQARFMVTSRIVGYEQCAIELPEPPPDVADGDGPGARGRAGWSKLAAVSGAATAAGSATAASAAAARAALAEPGVAGAGLGPAVDVHRLYVMPFDNGRIRQFARNWFEHGETEERRGEAYLEKFVAGVMRDPVALQLARTPNLLVMAAQVFGITNTLPDGRAKLYEAITKAYLESIDQRYGLVDKRYSLEQKKAWLAAVGYQMQARRSAASGDGARDLLVAESDVVGWLDEAMRESELEPDAAYVHSFVDAIARRSGLFIPRGEGQYAFAHLSIQEYFAALHLQNRVRDHAVSDPARLQALFTELAKLGAAPAWREALVTFFELPEWSPKVIATLFQAVFGQDLKRVPDAAVRKHSWAAPNNAALVETLSRLVVNPGIALPASLRERGFERAVAFLCSERQGKWLEPYSGVLGALTVNEEGSRRVWQLLRFTPGLLSTQESVLDLRGVRLVDFSPLSELTELTDLRLDDTLIADLSPLAGLVLLNELSLARTPVVSLAPLSTLQRLRSLDLSGTAVTDLAPLACLIKLTHLRLDGTAVHDLAPLSEMTKLHSLSLDESAVADLAPLAELRALRYLSLTGTRVGGLAPLQGLTDLEVLNLERTAVSDLRPLSNLKGLRWLGLNDSMVTDLSGLHSLALEHLSLIRTTVHDLAPLAHQTNLRTLMLAFTPVTDLTPLADLIKLTSLFLHGSAVTDTSALADLTELVIQGGPDRPKAKPRAKPKANKKS